MQLQKHRRIIPEITYPRVPGHEVVGIIDNVVLAVADGKKGHEWEWVGAADIA